MIQLCVYIYIYVLYLVAQMCPTFCDPMDCSQSGYSVHGNSPGKNTGVGCHVLLQGIFSTQGSDPVLLHCRQILYHLSHQGSPRILEWVASLYPFSRGSFWSGNRTGVPCIAGGYIYISILFYILFHYGLSQDIEYSSLYYTAGPCCLPILHLIVCIC